jgi:hypothetical protein
MVHVLQFLGVEPKTLAHNILKNTCDRSRCPLALRIRLNKLLEKKAGRDCVLNFACWSEKPWLGPVAQVDRASAF